MFLVLRLDIVEKKGLFGGGKEAASQGRREDLNLIPHSYLDTERCQVKCTTFLVPH